jgi:post-segregation antitoxin (ccd killing protein)
MHRTQIYFDEPLFDDLKRQANLLGISISAYIRVTLKRDIEEKKQKKPSIDFDAMSGIWEGRDITIESIREKAWK